MAFISKASIQEVTDRLDAIGVVSDYVQLEKKGGRWWACCPFHQEKTASFSVNPDLKMYYCFGCQKSGSIINFVMEMDKLSYPEAIEQLAKRFGVELVYDNSTGGNYSAEDEAKKKRKEGLFELYHKISGTFHHFLLKKHEAEHIKLYIRLRGISEEMIERFRLGYAPADRYWLYKFLFRKGYSDTFLASSGLFSSRYPEASIFSGRLMFPIADRQGRTVAFGGRFLPGKLPAKNDVEAPKYINSPELEIYKKGETLFAVDLAMGEIRRTKTVYIAEGYMDVIALHQAGITNALAPLGTAFTDEQAKLLKRWVEKVIFFFDSDDAGRTAVAKGILTCRRNGLASAVVVPEDENKAFFEKKDQAGVESPPENKDSADILKSFAVEAPTEAGSPKDPAPPKDPADILKNFGEEAAPPKDPADILKNFGEEALQKKAKYFINDFDYLISRARILYKTSSAKGQKSEGKARAVATLFPFIKLLESEVERNSCIETAADSFELLPATVADDYRRYGSEEHTKGIKEETNPGFSGGSFETPIRINDELLLLIVVAVNYISAKEGSLFPKFRASLKINEIEDIHAKDLYIALEECIRYGQTSMDDLLFHISSPELKKVLVERSLTGEFSVNVEQYVYDGIKGIQRKRLEKKQQEIIIKLRSLKKNVPPGQSALAGANDEETSSEVKELLAEKMEIDEAFSKL